MINITVAGIQVSKPILFDYLTSSGYSWFVVS